MTDWMRDDNTREALGITASEAPRISWQMINWSLNRAWHASGQWWRNARLDMDSILTTNNPIKVLIYAVSVAFIIACRNIISLCPLGAFCSALPIPCQHDFVTFEFATCKTCARMNLSPCHDRLELTTLIALSLLQCFLLIPFPASGPRYPYLDTAHARTHTYTTPPLVLDSPRSEGKESS